MEHVFYQIACEKTRPRKLEKKLLILILINININYIKIIMNERCLGNYGTRENIEKTWRISKKNLRTLLEDW